LFGQAFRAPNVFERYYYAEALVAPLTPEKIRTYELVLEHYFASDVRVGVSAYRYNVRDLISQIATPTGELGFANVERYAAEGAEVEFEARYSEGIQLRTSYAVQRARDEATGERLTSSPRHLAKVNVSFPFYKDRIHGGLELQYHSSVRTLLGATAGGALIGNLTVTARRVAGFDVSASVYNLANTGYGFPGAEDHLQDVLRQKGRVIRLKISRRF
jgi:iron complex outermembrane receptor protein